MVKEIIDKELSNVKNDVTTIKQSLDDFKKDVNHLK